MLVPTSCLELSLSLEKVANVSEAVGVVEVCVQFSDQFVEPFNIHLNTSAPESSAFGELVTISAKSSL